MGEGGIADLRFEISEEGSNTEKHGGTEGAENLGP
jgi:hypothetical protein